MTQPRDSRSKPVRATTVKQGVVHESGGAVGNRTNSMPLEAATERERIVTMLQNELTAVPRVGPDRAYRMGQNDALKLAIDAISRGDHLDHNKGTGDE